jgi:hypothetical protein
MARTEVEHLVGRGVASLAVERALKRTTPSLKIPIGPPPVHDGFAAAFGARGRLQAIDWAAMLFGFRS